MKRHRLLRLCYTIFLVLKLAIFAGLSYLEQLSYQKAGVNHHLRYRKTFILKNYLTQTNTLVMIIISVFLILLCTVFYYKGQKKEGLIHKLVALAPILWLTLLSLSLTTDLLGGLRAYPYFILGIGLASLLSLILRWYQWAKLCE